MNTLNDDSKLLDDKLILADAIWQIQTATDAAKLASEIVEALHQRDEARDKEIAVLKADIAYAIGRFQGMEMDSAYLEQRYPEWKQLTNLEKTNE